MRQGAGGIVEKVQRRDTYYDILGVAPTSSPDEIRAKYRALIQRVHPDLGGPIALFRLVQEAYEVLSDPVRRAGYDRTLEALHHRAGAREPQDVNGPKDRSSHRSDGRSGADPSRSGTRRLPHRNTKQVPGRRARRIDAVRSFNREYPARLAAIIGAGLVALGAALSPDNVSWSVLSLGVMALVLATVAGLGARGMKEREAYRRGGMAAVDAMTGRRLPSSARAVLRPPGLPGCSAGCSGEGGADVADNRDPQGTRSCS